MASVSRKTRQKTWRTSRVAVSVLAAMALRQEKVAAKLVELREDNALTQEQAAAKVGVTLRQWQRWEAAESMPYSRNLDAIATTFGFEVSEFFGDGRPAHELTAGEREILRVLDDVIARLERLEDQPPGEAA